MPSEKFKNTFAPNVTNDELTVDNVIKGLFLQLFKYTDLPSEVKAAVDKEMLSRTKK